MEILVDIERAPEGETPAIRPGMRTLADVISGCLPAANLRHGR
jgi:hypothetical protein